MLEKESAGFSAGVLEGVMNYRATVKAKQGPKP